jgi:membrane associated rhomboid family serine protease
MSQYHFQAPLLTKVNKVLLISAGGAFLAFSILKAIGAFSLVSVLGLSSAGLGSGLIYQLFTYPLMETQLMGFLFNALLIWFIGSELEQQWGSRAYLRFLLLVTISVGLIYASVGFIFFQGTYVYGAPLIGLSGLNFALLIAYAILYPDRTMSLMMIFPMKARTFCLVLAGIEAYLAIFNSGTSSWAHLLAMGISWAIIHFQSNSLLHKVLNSPLSKTKKRSKSHLYVVKEDDQKPPKYWQ